MSDFRFTEAELEETALEWLEDIGYTPVSGVQFEPDGELAARKSYSDVILIDNLKKALLSINRDASQA